MSYLSKWSKKEQEIGQIIVWQMGITPLTGISKKEE